MADSSSTAHLYLSVTQLAYAQTQRSIHPRPPFSLGDREGLLQQATEVADCAARFRRKDGARINQPALFAAQAKVAMAQTLFHVIETQPANNLAETAVVQAVAAAVQAVDAL